MYIHTYVPLLISLSFLSSLLFVEYADSVEENSIWWELKSFRSNVRSFVITASVLSILSFTRESKASTLLIKCSTALSKFSMRCNFDSKVETITSKTLKRYCSLKKESTEKYYDQRMKFVLISIKRFSFHSSNAKVRMFIHWFVTS